MKGQSTVPRWQLSCPRPTGNKSQRANFSETRRVPKTIFDLTASPLTHFTVAAWKTQGPQKVASRFDTPEVTKLLSKLFAMERRKSPHNSDRAPDFQSKIFLPFQYQFLFPVVQNCGTDTVLELGHWELKLLFQE